MRRRFESPSETRGRMLRCGQRPHRRRGIETVELLVVLPALLIMTVATLEFGLLVLTQQTITAASANAVREAAKVGMTNAERFTAAQSAIQTYFAAHGIPTTNAYIAMQTNSTTIDTSPAPANYTLPVTPSSYVRVSIVIKALDADVPNWLNTFGISLSNLRFETSSIVTLE